MERYPAISGPLAREQAMRRKTSLAAKVEEFFNKCHDEQGRFCEDQPGGSAERKPLIGYRRAGLRAAEARRVSELLDEGRSITEESRKAVKRNRSEEPEGDYPDGTWPTERELIEQNEMLPKDDGTFDSKDFSEKNSEEVIRKYTGFRFINGDGVPEWRDRPEVAEGLGIDPKEIEWDGETPLAPRSVGERLAEISDTKSIQRELPHIMRDPDELFNHLKGPGMLSSDKRQELDPSVVIDSPTLRTQKAVGGNDLVFMRASSDDIPSATDANIPTNHVYVKVPDTLRRLDVRAYSRATGGVSDPSGVVDVSEQSYRTKINTEYAHQDYIDSLRKRPKNPGVKNSATVVNDPEMGARGMVPWDDVESVHVDKVMYKSLKSKFDKLPKEERVIGSRPWTDVVKEAPKAKINPITVASVSGKRNSQQLGVMLTPSEAKKRLDKWTDLRDTVDRSAQGHKNMVTVLSDRINRLERMSNTLPEGHPDIARRKPIIERTRAELEVRRRRLKALEDLGAKTGPAKRSIRSTPTGEISDKVKITSQQWAKSRGYFEEKGGKRIVRTPEGARFFGVPIGQPIPIGGEE